MYSFLAFSSTASLLLWGAKGAKDAKLPITIGPQQKQALGPRDRL
jgi:photosystem I subunit 6